MSLQGTTVDQTNIFNWLAHSISVSAITGWVLGLWPFFIVTIPLIYYLIQIWETQTVRHLVNNWRQRRAARKYLKAKGKAKVAMAKLEAIELKRAASTAAREKVAVAAADAAKMLVESKTP